MQGMKIQGGGLDFALWTRESCASVKISQMGDLNIILKALAEVKGVNGIISFDI